MKAPPADINIAIQEDEKTMQTKTAALRPFANLFTAFAIALPLTVSLTGCDGVDEQDTLGVDDAIDTGTDTLDEELLDVEEDAVEAGFVEPAPLAGSDADLPLADAPHAAAVLCKNSGCNYKLPSSYGCTADAVVHNNWNTYSTNFYVQPMKSAACGTQWSRVCLLSPGYSLTAWDDYVYSATAKAMTALSGTPPQYYCVDSLMVSGVDFYARACGQTLFGEVACTPYY